MIETVYRARCARCNRVLCWFRTMPGKIPVREFTTVWRTPEEAHTALTEAEWTDLTCPDCRRPKKTTPQEET